jgi:hypothetical protein
MLEVPEKLLYAPSVMLLLLCLYLVDWFRAVQAMITVGLILLLSGLVAIIVYMFLHSAAISKRILIITFTVLAFAAGKYLPLL